MTESGFPEWLKWAGVAGGDPFSEQVVCDRGPGDFTFANRVPDDLEMQAVHIVVQPSEDGIELVVVRRTRGALRLRETAILLCISARAGAVTELNWNPDLAGIADDLDAWEADRLKANQLVARTLEKLVLMEESKGVSRLLILTVPKPHSFWSRPASRCDLWVTLTFLIIYLWFLAAHFL